VRTFYKDLIIVLGFASGLIVALGVELKLTAIELFGRVYEILSPTLKFRWPFYIIPLIILIGVLVGSFRIGRFGGLLAALAAFIAGTSLLLSQAYMIFFLLVAIAMLFVVVE
jgi:hypothetical protein